MSTVREHEEAAQAERIERVGRQRQACKPTVYTDGANGIACLQLVRPECLAKAMNRSRLRLDSRLAGQLTSN